MGLPEKRDKPEAKGDPTASHILTSKAKSHRVQTGSPQLDVANRIHQKSRTRRAMNQVQGLSRESKDQKVYNTNIKPIQEMRPSSGGSIQETSCLQRTSKVNPGGQYSYSVAQGGTEPSGLSLNGAPGPMGRACGWEPQVSLVRTIKPCQCTQGPNIMWRPQQLFIAVNSSFSISLCSGVLCTNSGQQRLWLQCSCRAIKIVVGKDFCRGQILIIRARSAGSFYAMCNTIYSGNVHLL